MHNRIVAPQVNQFRWRAGSARPIGGGAPPSVGTPPAGAAGGRRAEHGELCRHQRAADGEPWKARRTPEPEAGFRRKGGAELRMPRFLYLR